MAPHTTTTSDDNEYVSELSEGSDADDEGQANASFEPSPPLPEAAVRVMFDFPATSSHRSDSSRIPLEHIMSTVDVEVVENGPFGRRAIARRLIRAGTVLGWFDGLPMISRGDPLLDLHPYAYARSDSCCVVGSPLAWAS